MTEFERLIIYLHKNYTIVPLQKIFELHRKGEKTPNKTIALTFDDGYKNNFDVALPVLRKYKVPATFYLISSCLEKTDYLAWPDIVDLLRKYHSADVTLNNHVFKHPEFYSENINMYLADYLKTQGKHAERLASEIIQNTNYRYRAITESSELFQLIGMEELKTYANEGLLEIGSHSHCHPNMEYLSIEDAENELKKSKDLLETAIGKKVISFAFPDGSYKPETVTLAKKLGYENMVAVSYKYAENNKDPKLLSRFTVSNSTTFESNAIRLAKEFDIFGFN